MKVKKSLLELLDNHMELTHADFSQL